MITYSYECQKCNHAFEIKQNPDDPDKKRCPNCKKHGLFKVLTGGVYQMVYQEPKTVGHFASRKTEKMGNYELEARNKYEADRKIAARKQAQSEIRKKMPDAKLIDPESKPDGWHGVLPEPQQKALERGDAKAIDKYIREGD